MSKFDSSWHFLQQIVSFAEKIRIIFSFSKDEDGDIVGT